MFLLISYCIHMNVLQVISFEVISWKGRKCNMDV